MPCLEPNFLSYNDGGKQRKITIPDGSFEHAMEMYARGNFEALGRYETWEG